MNNTLSLLNFFKNTPVELWPRNIKLKAVSTNAHGIANSGILNNGTYFFRKHEFLNGAFTGQSEFVIG